MKSTSLTIFSLAILAVCVHAYDVNVDKLPEEFAGKDPLNPLEMLFAVFTECES